MGFVSSGRIKGVWLMAAIILVLLIAGAVMITTHKNVEKKAAGSESEASKAIPHEINVNTITEALQEKYHLSDSEINTIRGILTAGLRDNNIHRITGYGVDVNSAAIRIYVDYMNKNRVRKCLVFTLRRANSRGNIDPLGIDDYGEKCRNLILGASGKGQN